MKFPSISLLAILFATGPHSSPLQADLNQFSFLPDGDGHQFACMAMIPNCFTKKQWFDMCQDADFAGDHIKSCSYVENSFETN